MHIKELINKIENDEQIVEEENKDIDNKLDMLITNSINNRKINIIKKLKEKQEKKKYDKKKYNQTFYERNKTRILEKHICEICNGKYTYYNKSKHNTSNKHIHALERQITNDGNN